MRSLPRFALLLLLAAGALAAAGRPLAAPRPLHWVKLVLDPRFRSEGVAVADVNRDGRPDLLVGDLWYEQPPRGESAWRSHPIRPAGEYDPATGYSQAFLVFADDVDRDRWPDQLVIGFPGAPAKWYRNPGPDLRAQPDRPWPEFPLTESACNETPAFADLTGDGRPELVTPFQGTQMAFYRPGRTPREGFEQWLIGEPGRPGCQPFSHGLGVGDINGDGRPDILCTEGYYAQPRSRRRGETWPFVPAALGEACANMHTADFDGDGDRDVISSSAHAAGVWWYEQQPGPEGPRFVRHLIDDSFSQSHALVAADLDGDGRTDYVTGKRWWAHGPAGDVNPNHPAVLCWFRWERTRDGRVLWRRHEIDADSGVGTQFTVADVDRDGRKDVAVSNKKGVFLFLQRRG